MARVLLADDDDLFADLAINALFDRGFLVGRVDDGKKVIEAMRFRAPDVVILDCNMPELDGINALRIIRKDPLLYKIPVLILTGRRGVENENLARFDGANDYVSKPCNFDDLATRLRHLLANPHLGYNFGEWNKPDVAVRRVL